MHSFPRIQFSLEEILTVTASYVLMGASDTATSPTCRISVYSKYRNSGVNICYGKKEDLNFRRQFWWAKVLRSIRGIIPQLNFTRNMKTTASM